MTKAREEIICWSMQGWVRVVWEEALMPKLGGQLVPRVLAEFGRGCQWKQERSKVKKFYWSFKRCVKGFAVTVFVLFFFFDGKCHLLCHWRKGEGRVVEADRKDGDTTIIIQIITEASFTTSSLFILAYVKMWDGEWGDTCTIVFFFLQENKKLLFVTPQNYLSHTSSENVDPSSPNPLFGSLCPSAKTESHIERERESFSILVFLVSHKKMLLLHHFLLFFCMEVSVMEKMSYFPKMLKKRQGELVTVEY